MAIKTVKVTVNGTTVTATSSGNDTYTATLAAPNRTSYNVNSGHYYPVTVVATNMAGTSTTVNDQTTTLGTSLRLKVKELTAPTITITSPTQGQYIGNASPVLIFTLTDEANGSGINISSLVAAIDNTTYGNTSGGVDITPITNGYEVSVMPTTALADGEHQFSVEIRDNDGNKATSGTIKFITDTTAPTLSVNNPIADGYTANSNLLVSGTATDSTSGAPTVEVGVNGTFIPANIDENGDFNRVVKLTEGSNTVVIKATDKAGRTTTITRTIILDTSSPVVVSVNINPNPVNVGDNYTVTIKVTG